MSKKSIPPKDSKEDPTDTDHSVSLSMTEALAAWALSQQKSAYAPLNSSDRVSHLSSVANALNQDFGLNIGPSPMGSSFGISTDREDPDSLKRVRKPLLYQGASGERQIILEPGPNHAYVTEGQINGQSVIFLIDTGATQVSIPKRIAHYLNLKTEGRPSVARTANGLVETYRVRLKTISLGNIELRLIEGMINMGDTSDEVLLGMSALKELDLRVSSGRLILTQFPSNS